MKYVSLSALALCAGLLTPASRAETPEAPVKLPDLEVVTAARTSQRADEAFASVSVITHDEIRNSVAEDLPELLRLQAGVDVVRTGPAGAQTSVFLRGGNSDHLLVLIDGMRVASPHTGSYAWELIPLAAIDRIEIVRGPRAAWYGSDAMSGVVQIFTRQLNDGAARVTVGSFGTLEAEGGIGFETGRSRHSLNAAYRRSDGFSAQNSNGFSYHPDNDGLEVQAGGASGEFELEAGQLRYRALLSRTETDFDQGTSVAEQGLATLAWLGRVNARWDYQVQAGYFDDLLESDFGFFTTGFDARRLGLGFQNQLQLGPGRLGFGLDLVDEEGASADTYDADRDNRAAYLTWDARHGPAQFELGGRMDRNSQFGSEFTWQGAAAFSVLPSGQLGLQAGTAFRAPDFGELYSPGFGGLFSGNPDLEPETAHTLELNWRQDIGAGLRYTLSAYRSEIDDLIAFSGDLFQAVNVNRARIEGLEAEVIVRSGPWSLRANITLQDTRDKSNDQPLLRRPERKGSLSMDRHFENGGWLGMDCFVSGERWDVGSQKLPGYGVFSLRGGWALTTAITLEMRLENLFDAEFEPAAGFNSAGRSAFVSLDWRG